MRDARDTAAFVSADVAFHLRVAKDHGPSYRDHVPVHAAIERGDVAAAREAMRAHLVNAGERLKKRRTATR